MVKSDGLARAYDALPLFTDVSFVLADGDRVGLVGPNGAGKSTLLRLIAGLDRPDEGGVMLGDGDTVGYLAQQTPRPDLTLGEHLRASAGEVFELDVELRQLEAELSGGHARPSALQRYGDVQERYAALNGWGFHALVDDVRRHLDIAHLDPGTHLRRLSGGEQARVMLAGVLLARPTVLLLDEPTNHLDLAGLRWLEGYLGTFPGAVMVVSHDRRFLDNTVSRVFELDGVSDRLPLERPLLDFYRSRVVGYEDEARAFLGHFLFDQEQMHRPLRTLSPGERSRLLIAVLVSSGSELLLLDEPTNHLDFDSLDVVEEALRQFRGTIVAVSHDRAFVENIGCRRHIDIRAGRLRERTSTTTPWRHQ